MMVAAVSETTTTNQPPLLPSKNDHDVITPTRPKLKQVSSRYLSPSPSISRNSITPAVKRSVSVGRRPDPNNAGGGGDTTKLPVTSSTRSFPVSFQGETFSLRINKTKNTPQIQSSALIRKRTPNRRQLGDHHVENTKPMDHHRWPGRIQKPNNTLLSKTFALDYLDTRRVVSFDGDKSNLDLGESLDVLNTIQHFPDGNSVKDTYSDTDSVSSGSTSGVPESGLTRSRIGHSGITTMKFWQETNSRIRRLQDPSSPLSNSPKSNASQKDLSSKRLLTDNSYLSSARTMASPNMMRPSSPSKFMMTSASRGMISPRRNTVSGSCSNVSETPSVLSFSVDVRRGKVGENRFLDAHFLRLLYNRQLQWRFANARNEDLVLKQKRSIEEKLWNAWITMSDLRDSVTRKRHRLQLLRQKLKLASILKAQMVFLEDWAFLDKNHSISLLGAIEALKASTLRLPVAEGATVDLQSMKDAINSALDVMQAMGSSMNSLCLQVEEVNLMVTKIAEVSAKERTLLRICKDLSSVLLELKVKDCSLRTHMLQRIV